MLVCIVAASCAPPSIDSVGSREDGAVAKLAVFVMFGVSVSFSSACAVVEYDPSDFVGVGEMHVVTEEPFRALGIEEGDDTLSCASPALPGDEFLTMPSLDVPPDKFSGLFAVDFTIGFGVALSPLPYVSTLVVLEVSCSVSGDNDASTRVASVKS